MKWLDFSNYKARLLTGRRDGENYFIFRALPDNEISGKFILALEKVGFIKEEKDGDVILIALATERIKKGLPKIPRVVHVDWDGDEIKEHLYVAKYLRRNGENALAEASADLLSTAAKLEQVRDRVDAGLGVGGGGRGLYDGAAIQANAGSAESGYSDQSARARDGEKNGGGTSAAAVYLTGSGERPSETELTPITSVIGAALSDTATKIIYGRIREDKDVLDGIVDKLADMASSISSTGVMDANAQTALTEFNNIARRLVGLRHAYERFLARKTITREQQSNFDVEIAEILDGNHQEQLFGKASELHLKLTNLNPSQINVISNANALIDTIVISTESDGVKKAKIDLSYIKFSHENTDAYSVQSNFTLRAEVDGDYVGHIDYVVFRDEVSISFISVPEGYRRQGIATAMAMELQSQYPDTGIKWGLASSDGAMFYDSLPKVIISNEAVQSKVAELAGIKGRLSQLQQLSDDFDNGKFSDSAVYQTYVSNLLEDVDWNDWHDRVYALEEELHNVTTETVLIDLTAKIKDKLSQKEAVSENVAGSPFYQVLAVDIEAVLNNDDVNFDHFQAYLGKEQGASLANALRGCGLNAIGDVTGYSPDKFYSHSHEALALVFGPYSSDGYSGNAYLERKGLAQAFDIHAQKLVDDFLGKKSSNSESIVSLARKYRIDVDIVDASNFAMLVTLKKDGLEATLESRHDGSSFNISLHEDNPRSESSIHIENLIAWFVQQKPERAAKAVQNNSAADDRIFRSAAKAPLNPNHYFLSPNEISRGDSGFSPSARWQENIDAIRLLKQIQAESRQATPAEKAILVKYNGFGGADLAKALTYPDYGEPAWIKDARQSLREELTEDELRSLRGSVNNAHYTAPELVAEIWDGIQRAGFTGGKILEPSLGSGTFLGLMPPELVANSHMSGVEKELLTGQIAHAIYPDAKIHVKGFEEVSYPKSSQDLVITNVPFGDFGVHDPEYNQHNLSIHDYFIVRSLDQLKPGGIGAFITSSYTMDKQNDYARRLMHERGILAGAIRLPDHSQKAQAGCEVTTDILFFVKRDHAPDVADTPAWLSSKKHPEIDGDFYVNQYFQNNPQHVLGRFMLDRAQYGRTRVDVKNDRPMAEIVKGLFSERRVGHGIVTSLKNHVQLNKKNNEMNAPKEIKSRLERIGVDFDDGRDIGSLILNEKGDLLEVVDMAPNDEGGREFIARPLDLTGKPLERLRLYVGIRETVMRLFELQMRQPVDEPACVEQRNRLNQQYDEFVKKFGFLNQPTNRRAIKTDPMAGRVLALEIYDDEKDIATKSDIFSRNVIRPPKRPEPGSAKTPSDALLMCLAFYGDVYPGEIGDLCDQVPDEAIAALLEDGLLFEDPATNKLDVRERYLSGNVCEKMKQARAAAELEPQRFMANVEALQSVQPEDVPADDILLRLGSTWIPASVVRQFMIEELGLYREEAKVEYLPALSEWVVDTTSNPSSSVTSRYGTTRRTVMSIFAATLNQETIKVTDTVEIDGKKQQVVNPDETLAANEKANLLKARFKEWIFEDDTRRDRMVRLWNDRFNNYVPAQYDGSHMEFPGMNPAIAPRPHQANAAWRTIMDGNALYGHEVGTGKTISMVATAMEIKRLGRANKPMIVVKNHMLEQVERESRQLYPGAKILVVTKDDLAKEKRAKFFGKASNNDWDIVIITHSQFGKLQVNPEFRARFIRRELDKVRAQLGSLDPREHRITIKAIEASVKRLERKFLEAQEAINGDVGIHFDDLGVDSIIVDESHNFKNLEVQSSQNAEVSGGIAGSARALDLYMKTQWLYEKRGSISGMVFATGTPVSNHVMEIYNLQRYLQPQLLKEMECESINAWASNFLEANIQWEPEISGAGFKQRARYALTNVPELMKSLSMVMDFVKAEDIPGLVRPEVERTNIVADLSETQAEIMDELNERLIRLREEKVDPRVDNHLNIVSDGRKLAIDPRLNDRSNRDFEGSKVNLMVENVIKHYRDSMDDLGTQLIFCDYGVGDLTGKDPDRFSVYRDVRQKLMASGVSEQEIAFIQDAKTDVAKAELFAKVRMGDVRILLGTTAGMGEGTNVQARLVSLHHLDAPWRPSDIEQRRGRMVRHGNLNKNTFEYIYTTEGTFDMYMWTTLKTKHDAFVSVLSGKFNGRKVDMETDPTYAETMAITSNNPLLKDKLEAEQVVNRLMSLARSEDRQQQSQKSTLERNKSNLADMRREADFIDNLNAKYGDLEMISVVKPAELPLEPALLIELGDEVIDQDLVGDLSGIPKTTADDQAMYPKWTLDLTPFTGLKCVKKKYPDQIEAIGNFSVIQKLIFEIRKEAKLLEFDGKITCSGAPVIMDSLGAKKLKGNSDIVWSLGDDEMGRRQFNSMNDLEDWRLAAEEKRKTLAVGMQALEAKIEELTRVLNEKSSMDEKIKEAQKELDRLNRLIEGIDMPAEVGESFSPGM